MSLLDWLIVLIPLAFVMGVGIYSRKYTRSVADFVQAGRICGRYVISVGDVANALAILTLVSYVEVHYKTGFALGFWSSILSPLGIVLGLYGYCVYRFRETKALSLGQFLEMRYNRTLRIFAAALRSIAEMIANMIMPALAARFFIYYMDLPQTFNFCGLQISTFLVIVFISLTLAISLICLGGTLCLVITDAIQGIFMYPMMVVIVAFILYKFSWTNEIVQVMHDRGPGESFLSPYDVTGLRDFNLFMLCVTVFTTIFHRASWIGAGTSGAAKSPHEQKMAGLLGTWRGAMGGLIYVLIAVTILTFLNHQKYAKDAQFVKTKIATRISEELILDDNVRAQFKKRMEAIPLIKHQIVNKKDGRTPSVAPVKKVKKTKKEIAASDPAVTGVYPLEADGTYDPRKGKPLTGDDNLDTPYLNAAHEAFKSYYKVNPKSLKDGKNGNAIFAQFNTLYHQLMLAMTMRYIFPKGLVGLFCIFMILAMLSTDDTRIFSATLTITQDVIAPFLPKDLKPTTHLWIFRIVAILIGVFFFFGSFFMAQLDYIQLYATLVTMMWMGGCGPLMIFGLYSKFGTTAGAFSSLIVGMVTSLFSIYVQRNWPDYVYPWLEKQGWVEPVGDFLATVSKPLNPYVVWKMNPVKCPINAYEIYFMIMVLTLIIYCVVSWCTMKEPFNLDRMLHRGIYNTDGENKTREKLTLKTALRKMIGITPEYTHGDRIIAWAIFFYSFVYAFVIKFLGTVIWNAFHQWPDAWWGHYFFFTSLVIPGIAAVISTFWFGIGGAVDLFRLFRDLERRVVNDLDNGSVEGNVSISDIDEFKKREEAEQKRK